MSDMEMSRFPESFSLNYSGVDFEPVDRCESGHNEKCVTAACGRNDLFVDSFDIEGQATSSGYRLEIAVDSEVDIGLFDGGRTVLIYDNATKLWSMTAKKADGSEWTFCSANVVIDMMIVGLGCIANDADVAAQHQSFLKEVVGGLSADRDHIIDSAALYTNAEDCKVSHSTTPAVWEVLDGGSSAIPAP